MAVCIESGPSEIGTKIIIETIECNVVAWIEVEGNGVGRPKGVRSVVGHCSAHAREWGSVGVERRRVMTGCDARV